jgi:hypothetical protein
MRRFEYEGEISFCFDYDGNWIMLDPGVEPNSPYLDTTSDLATALADSLELLDPTRLLGVPPEQPRRRVHIVVEELEA